MVKKLIVVSVMLALVLAAAITEIFFVGDVYDNMNMKLDKLEQAVSLCDKDHIDNPEIAENVKEVEEYWRSKRNVMMLLGNHNVIHTVGDKLQALSAAVEKDVPQDAYINVRSLNNYIEEIRNDIIPSLSNVF